MNTNPAKFLSFVLSLVVGFFSVQTAKAGIVEVIITGNWSEKDFKVTSKKNAHYDSTNAKFDGLVFGMAPSDGGVTLNLIVNTEDSIFFAKDAAFSADGVGPYTLKHDLYGYREVSLVDGSFRFGSAIWKSDGILRGLEGPDRVKAALWTDANITKGEPTRVSFRMFGRAGDLTADIFVGSRTHSLIGTQFLLWEYYNGEEIRSEQYKVSTRVLRD